MIFFKFETFIIINFLINDLVSTFWKDSPSSFYWDVWNTKLIKTDENGVQTGSIIGYGCQCEGKNLMKINV